MMQAIGITLSAGLLLITTSVPYAQNLGASAEALPTKTDALSGAEPTSIPVDVERPVDPIEESSRPSSSRLIEEIVVTAQKREENLKDVPISVQAFSADYLDAKGVLSQSDLPRVTPGLTISNPIGFTTTFIRGIGTDAFILADPVVVTYIDDVYFPNAASQGQDFGDVERIEILKGPQGTLFGRNALGGAIRIQTKNPSLVQPEGSITSSYGTNNAWKSRASISIPLSDTLAFSMAGLYYREDFHLDGASYGPDHRSLPPYVSKAFRAKLYWKPTEDFEATLNASHYNEDSTNSQFTLNVDPSILIGGNLVKQQRRSGYLNEDLQGGGGGTTVYGKLSYSAPWFDIRLLGSDQDLSFTKSSDFDATPLRLAYFDSTNIYSRNQSAEFQLVSNKESLFAEWLEWITGVYYFKSNQGLDPAGFYAGQTDLSKGLIAGIKVPAQLSNVLGPIIGTLPVPDGVQINLEGGQLTDSIAYFGQATISFTEWLSMTLGGRYQDEKRELDSSSSGVRLANGAVVPIQSYSGKSNPAFRDHGKHFDPKVSVSLRPQWAALGEGPLIYASYQTATTSAVFNVINLYDRPEKVKASEIEAYEIGFKSIFFDRLVSINASAFDYTLTNSQAQVISLQSGGAVRFENVPELVIRGFDFDALIRLFPDLTNNGLVMTLSGAYLDSKYTNYENAGGFNEITGLYTQTNNYTGNRVVQTPKFSGSAGLTQTFQIPGGSLDVGFDYYYNSGFYFYAQNTSNIKIEPHGTLGFNVSYLYEPSNIRVSVFGTNILKKDYDAAFFLNDFGADVFPARLAEYGVRFQWQF